MLARSTFSQNKLCLLILSFLICVLTSQAKAGVAGVKVAFVKPPTNTTPFFELEKGSRFIHVAISYQGAWLHAHPRKGVLLSNSLTEVGSSYEVLHLPHGTEPDPHLVQALLHRPFDKNFDWSDLSRIYCSELIARVLHIAPTPMTFHASHWGPCYQDRKGQPGLSPDEVHTVLLRRGWTPWKPKTNCSQSLVNISQTL